MTDTGPDIHRPRAGSNAIGSFIIGVSPIGDIPVFDFWSTILSQYANSPILTQLCSNMAQYIDQTENLQNFFDLAFNVDTAVGWGLDAWGRIVGVNRVIAVVNTGKFFGFEEAGTLSADPFNQSPFFSGSKLTNNFSLSDDSFRTLIFAKALANISDGSIASLNQLLLNLFPNRGNVFVVDNLDMTMDYTFQFVLTPVELAIAESSGALPKPTGVAVSVVQDV